MPNSGDFQKRFRKGDRLKADDLNQMAGQIHQLASVGDAGNVISIGGGMFRRPKRVTPQIRDAVLTSAMTAAGTGAPQDGKTTFTFKFLFQDPDDSDLLIEGTEVVTGVNRNAGLTGSSGDYVAVAKMGPEWRALGGGSDGGTTLTDGCECDSSQVHRGVPLDGSPTICCTGHESFTVNLGTVIGEKTLYHAGGDVWSTFNADSGLDNPVVVSCGSGLEDEYDVVMDIAAGTITLEARAALNCDPVCFEYQRELPFACLKGNQFNLIKFTGIDVFYVTGTFAIGIPSCVCAVPDPRWGYVEPEACTICGESTDLLGQYVMVTVSVGDITNPACPGQSALCDPVSDVYLLERVPGFCSFAEQLSDDTAPCSSGAGDGNWRVTMSVNTSALTWGGNFCRKVGSIPVTGTFSGSIPSDFCDQLLAGTLDTITLTGTATISPGLCGGDLNYCDDGTVSAEFFLNAPPPPDDSGNCVACGS